MADSFKLNIKLPGGGGEFNAEGPEEIVQALFLRFLAALEKAPAKPEAAKEKERHDQDGAPPAGTSEANNGQPPQGVPRAILDRVFMVDRGDVVSLRVFPKTETRDADTLMLLLYGRRELRGDHDMTSTQLMKAARQSGLQLDRVDRVLALHEAFITRAGQRKGTRYGLNNRGIQYAEGLLSRILE